MCHRRGDWSRTSSRASEPEEDPDENSAWVGARAKDLLVTFVSGGTTESENETPDREKPERPAVEADPETPSTDSTESGVEEDADEPELEREEEPIPADD